MTDVNPDQVADTTTSDEELELDLELDGTEDTETLAAQLEKERTAKKQILARAKKAEAEAKALKEAASPAAEAPAQTNDDKLWEIADLIQQGYTKNDAEFINKNGGSQALKDPNSYVSVALKSIREQRRAEAEASKTDDSSGMSGVERKYSPEKLKNMTAEELEKILPKADPQ